MDPNDRNLQSQIVEINLGGELFQFNTELLRISETTLQQDMSQHALIFANVAVARTKAGRLQALAELSREKTWQAIWIEFKTDMEAKNMKYTQGDLTAFVHSDPRYQEAVGKKIKADTDFYMLNNLCDAITQRKDLMVQISANLRIENKLSPA